VERRVAVKMQVEGVKGEQLLSRKALRSKR